MTDGAGRDSGGRPSQDPRPPTPDRDPDRDPDRGPHVPLERDPDRDAERRPTRDPLAVRCYRRALVLLPRGFREDRGPARVAMLADEWRDRRGPGRAILLARALLDLLGTAAAERIRPGRPRRARGGPPPGGKLTPRPGREHGPTGPVHRATRSGPSLLPTWLDARLGFRMLIRYPGLTVVGGVAMAFAICIGAASYELLSQAAGSSLPFPEGDRIVGLGQNDVRGGGRATPSLHDYAAWKEGLSSLDGIGAYRHLDRSLVDGQGIGRPVVVAEITPSAFRIAGVPPLLGRPLVEADEAPSAPPVVVIGEGVWRSHFAGAGDIVGRTVRLGGDEATVVGVMPEGFGFPIWHQAWTPLRLDPVDYAGGPAPSVSVFGRLAPDVDLEAARAELATVGARQAADAPDTHGGLRPVMLPYTRSVVRLSTLGAAFIMSANLFLVALLVVVCGNVALLMFARAATRWEEIVVRSALGASRRRIVTQLFVEALVLGAVAAAAGLAVAGRTLGWGMEMVKRELMNGNDYPFWVTPGLGADTVAYAGGLTVLAALVAGALPGLKITGRRLAHRLQAQSAGGGGVRMGGVWTAVIVAQVALTVVFPATGFLVARGAADVAAVEPEFDDAAFVSARLEMDGVFRTPRPGRPPSAGLSAAFQARLVELTERLEADPEVLGVTYADHLPRMYHPWTQVEVDRGAPPPADPGRGHRANEATVAPDFFDVLGAPVLAGRGFAAADVGSEARVVVVNQSFVDDILGGRNPLGRRIRRLDSDFWNGDPPLPLELRPWFEIVGVVPDLGTTGGSRSAGIYHPLPERGIAAIHAAVRVRGDPAAFVPRLGRLVTSVDPALRLYEPQPLADADFEGSIQFLRFWFRLVVGLSVVATGLALTGIYAVMSFTVARRTREIGVRIALGADGRRMAMGVFRRPLGQVALGLALGVGATAMMTLAYRGPEAVTPTAVMWLAAYGAAMAALCATACVVPTLRALRLEPTLALSADG